MTSQRRSEDEAPALRPVFEYVPASSLTPHHKNPRTHPRQQVRAIARSIQAFGFNAPILVDQYGRVLAGHGRLEAANLLGVAEVPIVRLGHLSEEQAKAYMLADNKLTDRSGWNDEQLARCLKDLQNIALNFDIEATGFDMPEIDLRIQSLDPDGDAADRADEFEQGDGPIVSQIGDIWHLGPHRLICGNALEAGTYDAFMGGELASAVFTDPPYNVRIHGNAVGKGRKRHREFPMASGEMDHGEFQAFLETFLGQTRARMEPTAVGFLCMDWRHLSETTSALGQCGFETINVCVWSKTNGGMGALYRSAHEFVFVFRGVGAKNINNVKLGSYGRNRTNVWHYAGMSSFARKGQSRALDIHPTVKPVGMVADAILDVTRPKDVVLDPFCGSGTTLLAAERTGRRGYGIELDPKYVDLTIARWQRMTDEFARHANGKTFAEIAVERDPDKTGDDLDEG